MDRLKRHLTRIDREGYGAYKDITGTYDYRTFKLNVRHVQSDPFAPPGRFEVEVPLSILRLPSWALENEVSRTATADWLLRRLHDVSRKFSRKRGSGNSGLYAFARPGQEIIKRSGVEIGAKSLTIRFGIGLPADGRRINGRIAIKMLIEELPAIIQSIFPQQRHDAELKNHVETALDASFIRQKLSEKGLVAFIAEGAILPRASGVDDRPLDGAVPFNPSDELAISFKLPSGRQIKGMGIPEGVTLIAGGGFHGKSTLLEAIQFGVYNHIPGDGRELAVTVPAAVKIRAEDGRYISNVDISAFIRDLPSSIDTKHFSTEDASGSTSQAANIIEAIEMGATVFLIDEDTSATNFMIRDELMRELIRKEPIVPYIDRARELYSRFGISSIIVVGGAGDYLSVADTVILMEEYQPICATQRAKEIASRRPYRVPDVPKFRLPSGRQLRRNSVSPYRGRKIKVDAKSKRTILFGSNLIDLSAVEQIVEREQTRAIGKLLLYAIDRYGELTVREMIENGLSDVIEEGFSVLRATDGFLTLPRSFEVSAALNRLRGAVFD